MVCSGRSVLSLLVMMLLCFASFSLNPVHAQQTQRKSKLHSSVLQEIQWFNSTTITQVKIHLETGDINDEFFQKVNDLISQLIKLNTAYFNTSATGLSTALSAIENFPQLLTNVTSQFATDDTVTLVPFNPLPTPFLQSQTFPILSSLKSSKPVKDDADTKKLTDEIELQLTQMQQLISGQITIYNSIVNGNLPYTQLPSILGTSVNISLYDTVASEFISAGYFENNFFAYYAIYGFSNPTLISKLFIAPYGSYSLEFPIFYHNEQGYIFTSNLPCSLATAVEVYDARTVQRVLNDDPASLTDLLFTLDHEPKMPEPFFNSQRGNIVFNNENSKTPFNFGKLEAYSPIISSFAQKVIKIGTNTLKFILQLNAKEHNIVNIDTDQFILDHLQNIFNFDLEYFLLFLIIPVVGLFAIIIIISCKIANRYKTNKERKHREKDDYKSVNMIYRTKSDLT